VTRCKAAKHVKAWDAVSGENLEEEKPRGDRPWVLVNNQYLAERISTRDKALRADSVKLAKVGNCF